MLMINEVAHSSRCLLVQPLHTKDQLCLLLPSLACMFLELTLHVVFEINKGVPQDSFHRALTRSSGQATAFERVIDAYSGLIEDIVADHGAYQTLQVKDARVDVCCTEGRTAILAHFLTVTDCNCFATRLLKNVPMGHLALPELTTDSLVFRVIL
jgi:hypothetical protein